MEKLIDLNKRYIFLDIDGVLATSHEYGYNNDKFISENEWARKLRISYPFNSICVNILNEIIKTTNAEIVITSDWKNYWSLIDLNIIFKMNGVLKSPIYKTDDNKITDSRSENRMNEIYDFLKAKNMITIGYQPKCNWVVIDDLDFKSYFPESLKDRLFITHPKSGLDYTGLKDQIINKLIQ